ncbi:tripartite motif-containing protein 2/3 [Mytilus galloprovincialis]|uniref:Tripartite motif-containing protein 2/3 n=1 Tax=Mytilus galloprovincialis TaxID=29158 RepID=A0A8B6GQU2_MYTGA|nr:tripartite motif-containing protein 2/3 [Mytilus galloprovincialis]
MAEGGLHGSIREKRLQCLHCKTQFDEENHLPRVLPCLHTFCSTCLEKLLKNNILTCPTCHDNSKTSGDSLETYQVDFTRKDLVSFHKKFCQSSKVECDMCDNKADFWCDVCENLLCSGCNKGHEKNKKWRTHKVVSITEIKDPSHFRHEVLCSREGHKNKPLEVYCTGDSCKKVVCGTCWMVDHSDKTEHTPTDIEDQFVEERDSLLKKAEKLNEKQVQITRLQKRIDGEAYDVTKQTISADFEISSFFNQCIKLLEKRRDELLETVNTISQNKEIVLTKQKQELEESKYRLSDANIFLEQSCLSNNSAGFLNLVPVINQRFEDLIQEKYDEAPRVGSHIGFSNVTTGDDSRILKGKNLQKIIEHHAAISATNAYPPRTEMIIVNTRGHKTLQVTLKDFKENTINDSSLRVSAVLKDESSGDVTQLRFTSMGNGRFKSLQNIKDSDVYIQILLNKKQFTEEVKIESLNCVTGNPEEETDNVEENDLFGEEKEFTDSEGEWDFSPDKADDINHENEAVSLTTDRETCSILIDGFCESKITENDIRDYFSNNDLSGGGTVKKIEFNIDEGWCVVVFTSSQDMKDVQKKSRVWGIHIEREVLQFFETLQVKEYKIDPNEWNLIKKSVHQVDVKDKERVMITTNENRFSIVVVGYQTPFKSLVNHINLLTDSVRVRERLENHEIRLLAAGKEMESIRNEHKSINIVPDLANSNIEYSGTAAIVASAKHRVSDTLKTKVTLIIQDIANERYQFFKRKSVQKELEKEFKDKGVTCAVEFEKDNKIIIYALSRTEGEKAVNVVKKTIAEVNVGKETPPGLLDKELQEVRKKKGDTVEVRRSDSKIIIYAIPQSTVEAIKDHIIFFVRYPHGSVRCTAHFCTETGQSITTLLGDITDLDADVIVCSSDKHLKLGIGVGHDLVQKGGDQIQLECHTYLQSKQIKELNKDEVFCSSSGKLTNFRWVVHIPGEKWENVKESSEIDGKNNFIKLITSSLEKAEEKKSKSIAMPALCCGNNEYPVNKSTDWIVEALNEYLKRPGSKTSIRKIYLCDKNPSAVDNFVKKLKAYKYALIYNRDKQQI